MVILAGEVYSCQAANSSFLFRAMTRINEYLWHLPHQRSMDDPPEVGSLTSEFNDPILYAVSESLAAQGYNLSTNDVMVKLDGRVDNTFDSFYANVRFMKYLSPDILVRVHFEHVDWALFFPDSDAHTFYVNLDRFKTVNAQTQQMVSDWEGRLHTRLSSNPDDALHFADIDQLWQYSSPDERDARIGLFLDKFERLAVPWLEDLSRVG